MVLNRVLADPSLKKGLTFGQLKGFSDQLAELLVQNDMQVYKYLPYGPTEVVMPYFVRRGQESKQVVREIKFQNKELRNEILDRLRLPWLKKK